MLSVRAARLTLCGEGRPRRWRVIERWGKLGWRRLLGFGLMALPTTQQNIARVRVSGGRAPRLVAIVHWLRASSVVWVVLGLLATRPAPVRACSACGFVPPPAAFTRPEPDEATSAGLERQSVLLRCEDSLEGPVCTFRANYAVRNPSAEAQRLRMSLGCQSVAVLRAIVNGLPVPIEQLEATKEIYGRLGPAALAWGGDGYFPRGEHLVPSLVRFESNLPPNSTSALVVEGTVRPRPRLRSDVLTLDRLPMSMRHPLLGLLRSGPWHDYALRLHHDFVYSVERVGRWAAVAPAEVTVEYPDDWDTDLGYSTRPTPRPPATLGESPAPAGHKRIWVRCLPDTKGAVILRIETPDEPNAFSSRREPWDWGGPLLALGGDVTSPRGFRMRFGYEMAFPHWLVYSLAFDTDYRTRLTVAPGVELASSRLDIAALSAALGLGMPVRMFSHPAVGVRAQAGLLLPMIGILASVDVYPSEWHEPDADRVDALLLGRISF
jgi:hypothetical protein